VPSGVGRAILVEVVAVEREIRMRVRNVVTGKLNPGVSRETLEAALAAIVALDPEGCLAVHAGVDAGLREGNWSFAITNDFVDVEAYQRYDLDPAHVKVRGEMFAPICQDIARVQFSLE
jgi:hypothetical protein